MSVSGKLPHRSPDGTYEVLLKSFLEDPGLTDAEFRVAAYLASKPEDWVASVPQIARDLGRPPERVRRALTGLRAKGYAKIIEVRGRDQRFKRRLTMLTCEKVLLNADRSHRVDIT